MADTTTTADTCLAQDNVWVHVEFDETVTGGCATEFGTAQRIARIYAPTDGNEDDPARFELGPTSYEERRNAYPALGTPVRPTSGYQLGDGIRLKLGPAAVTAGEPAGELASGQ